MDTNGKLVLGFHSLDSNEASLSSYINRLHSFFPGISKVRDMIIYLNTFKLI
ncbi:predicted protein [Arabidopsis lyrata subsp. lyrata]|uniref:Predicted protein n=1 Tax=Arabidopsis lyrata subsp. lyrata TaxID=81972 RepID=D7MT04_ARALL|nr:predicted protein [Arabidopsis lyrata subsp. lyrata]